MSDCHIQSDIFFILRIGIKCAKAFTSKEKFNQKIKDN